MNQMHNISNGLKSNLCAVKSAAAGRGPRREQTIATLLSIEARLGLVCGATRLVQYLLYL